MSMTNQRASSRLASQLPADVSAPSEDVVGLETLSRPPPLPSGAFEFVRSRSIRALNAIWKWSPLKRNCNRGVDQIFADIWKEVLTDADYQSGFSKAIDILRRNFPHIAGEPPPGNEEALRDLVRRHCLPPDKTEGEKAELRRSDDGKKKLAKWEAERILLLDEPEEAWCHLPAEFRYLLAALNGYHLERKLKSLAEWERHTKTGRVRAKRLSKGALTQLRTWNGTVAISRRKVVVKNVFAAFLVVVCVFGNVTAGFLNERSYNQRMLGGRVLALTQLFFLFRYKFTTSWLLYNWSLERAIGALLANIAYALVALFPRIRSKSGTPQFEFSVVALSTCWQIGVQFWYPFRDFVERGLVGREIVAERKQADLESGIEWRCFDETVENEVCSHGDFIKKQFDPSASVIGPYNVPLKVLLDRHLRFLKTFGFGRPCDQLISLYVDYLEEFLSIMECYNSSRPSALASQSSASGKQGHAEPRKSKSTFIIYAVLIFGYSAYSFYYTQPYTFSTVVPYGAVVIIKLTIITLKRFQTAKTARRIFTNMVAFNIWAMLVVSAPVTIDKHILEPIGNMIGLTVAMVVLHLFLTEPIAPCFGSLSTWIEKVFFGLSRRILGVWNIQSTPRRRFAIAHGLVDLPSLVLTVSNLLMATNFTRSVPLAVLG
jgi:hypothetical protein